MLASLRTVEIFHRLVSQDGSRELGDVHPVAPFILLFLSRLTAKTIVSSTPGSHDLKNL